MKFTAALVVESDEIEGHITLCFCDAKKSGKVSTLNGRGDAKITSIEYWSRVNLTVALVDCELAHLRNKYYSDNGYSYDHEFIPHLTICEGDSSKQHEHLLGHELEVVNEYVRIF